MPGNQVSLKALPGCLHINEYLLFSTGVGAPPIAFPPNLRPPVQGSPCRHHQASHLLGSAWLSTAQLRPWELWKHPSIHCCLHRTATHRIHSVSSQPSLQDHGQLNAKCLPSGVGWWGTDRKQHQGRQGLEMSLRSHTATGRVRKAPWKQVVDGGPRTYTHKQGGGSPSRKAAALAQSLPCMCSIYTLLWSISAHTSGLGLSGCAGAAIRVTWGSPGWDLAAHWATKLEERLPQALE